ncbi:ABC transporter permease [Mycetocola spongiae]|uniref:ABC transporter permease n=1 Tax=Mycetocola spongiae TaxID=2859226 RepID=UPI001CF47A04|nr:ABC transporter permease [Mycetocola spongiae]UCR90171.1 ABC transporter permease [Mycetocola spongiae]
MTALAPAAPRLARRGSSRWLGSIGYFVVLAEIILFSVASPHFLSADNLATILGQAAVYAIAAFGLTLVVAVGGDDVIRGGIDLSIGATLGLAGAVVALLSGAGAPFPVAVLAGLAVGAAIGLLNGLVVVAGVRPLLVTLATMSMVASLTIVLTNNVKIPATGPEFALLRDGGPAGLSGAVLVLIVVFAIVAFLLGRTRWGTRAYAVGQNPVAARVAGISVARYTVTSYVCASILAALAGVLMTARLSAALPGIGEQMLIDILLASLMSIAFSRRLVVTITGTLFSAVFVAVLTNGFTQLGVGSQWIGIAKGALILIVLAVAAIRERSVRR